MMNFNTFSIILFFFKPVFMSS